MTVKKADTFMKRFLGLMFKRAMPIGHGILLMPCSGIHTCFMRFPIDVIYLSDNYEVLGIETVGPWRLGRHVKGAKMVLELPAGCGAQLKIGSSLIFTTL